MDDDECKIFLWRRGKKREIFWLDLPIINLLLFFAKKSFYFFLKIVLILPFSYPSGIPAALFSFVLLPEKNTAAEKCFLFPLLSFPIHTAPLFPIPEVEGSEEKILQRGRRGGGRKRRRRSSAKNGRRLFPSRRRFCALSTFPFSSSSSSRSSSEWPSVLFPRSLFVHSTNETTSPVVTINSRLHLSPPFRQEHDPIFSDPPSLPPFLLKSNIRPSSFPNLAHWQLTTTS